MKRATSEIGEHLYATGALRWETQLCPNTSLEHLDQNLIDRYLALRAERSRLNLRHTSREELLLGLHCAARDLQTDQMRPTNIGVLMFGFDPQFHIPQSEVVCFRYKDSLGVGRYVDRKIISGTPMELIDRAQEFLTTHMRVGAEIVGFKRVDLPEYPIEALREAIVNAVTHRDYSRIGEAIRIFFYADRIEVHSPGLLPPGVALEDLVAMRAPSRPRNPILAQFLRDIPGYVERIGAGIRLMVNEMHLMGLPAPEFVEQHEFAVIFRNGQQRDETTSGPLNPRQIIALRLIQERGSITSREYSDMTGAPERTELRDMIDRGLIVVHGKTRSARYYLA